MLPDADDVAGVDEGDAEPAKRRRPGLPVEPARLLAALRGGARWLVAVAALGIVAGVVIARFVVRHTYESATTLRFEGVAPLDDAQSEDAISAARRDLPARLESLRREELVREVRARMGMDGVPLAAMQRLFRSTQDVDSGLVTIVGTGESPDRAALLANTVVDVLIAREREQRRIAIETAIAQLEQRVAGAEAELALARSRYDAFRQEHGITDLTTEQEAGLAQAADLRAQADLAVAEIASLEARVRELREEVQRMPRMEVISSQSTSVDGQELARAEANLQRMRGTLTADHPHLQVAERQVRALRERMRGGGTHVAGTVSMGARSSRETAETNLATAQADLEATRRRSVELARLADEAQARVAGFSAIEGEATALLADLEVKERLLQQLSSNRARLETLREHADPGFRVIAPASPPETAVQSSRKMAVAAAVPLALVLLVVLALFAREYRGLRLRTPSEIAWWGDAPVVGATTWPRDPEAGGDLVADLDDALPEAKGSMLIVAASDDGGPLATDLARRMGSDWTDAVIVEPAGGGVLGDVDVLPAPVRGADGRDRHDQMALFREGSLAGAPDAVLRARSRRGGDRLDVRAWTGAFGGHALRRAARLVDRVLVVVPAGTLSARDLASTATRLGRSEGIAYAVVGLADEHASLPDRVGPIESFWNATRSS